MGQKQSHTNKPRTSLTRQEQPLESKPSPSLTRQEQPLSKFYHACSEGNIEMVKNLLPSMSIEQINCREPNGSTALHAASYHSHVEIVRLLLDAGACRSTRNLRYGLTPYQEASQDNIRELLSRAPLSVMERFVGLSSKTEWSLDTSQAAEWKIHLSSLLVPELSFQEIILYLQRNYLNKYVNLPSNELDKIIGLFRRAYEENDATSIVQAYTSPTGFYAIVNNHLAQYLLKSFRFDKSNNVLEQCVAHLASIFIHRPELKCMAFTGSVYRGLLLHQSDLETYTVDKQLLNKSFLSTSKERSVASIYGGIGDQTKMRTTIDKTPLQYTALCRYLIRNKNTALDISCASEIPHENEVLIMPLCAFQVRSVRRNDDINKDFQIEIELEECDKSIKLQRKNLPNVTRPRVT